MWAVARWPVTGSPPRMRGKGGRVVGRPLDDRITPRMRGKATPGVPTFTVPRITPAYAGKRARGIQPQQGKQDHPRVCGEKSHVFVVYCFSCSLWITPAYAGKRNRRFLTVEAEQDHPRVCGEKLTGSGRPPVYAGSPPRMRGKVQFLPKLQGLSRDHPRVCGEKRTISVLHPARRGSPPRMRGKDTVDRHAVVYSRITPAYAGKSKTDRSRNRLDQDHPRVCGEKGCDPGSRSADMGSPPRMRGKD